MTLAAGTKLGSYEIVSPLGAGWMGEVYRATNKKVNRDFAIKVIPQEFLRDEQRRRVLSERRNDRRARAE